MDINSRKAVNRSPQKELDPKDTVDRKVQGELFTELLQFKSSARLLRVHDKPGTGKSALLRMLEYKCRYEFESPKPVSLVPLEELSERNNFELIGKIREDLQPVEFGDFDKLRGAYEKQDPLPFQTTGILSGKVDLGGASVTGGVQAGVATVTQGPQYIQNYNAGGSAWNSRLDKYAEEECIKAFLRELKVVCATQDVVLLLDSWDNHRTSPERRNWLQLTLIKPYCLDTASPAKFIVVVAGQDVPDFKKLWGGAYSDSVRESPLEVWGEDHVGAFLRVHGYTDISPADVTYLCHKIKNEGVSLQSALEYMALIKQMLGKEAG